MTQARNQTFPKWVRLHPVGFKAVRPQSSCPLIQQGGMGSAVKPRPQTHVYAFRARKWHPVLTFLVILCNVSWFRLTRGGGVRSNPSDPGVDSTAWSVYDWHQNYSTDSSTRRSFFPTAAARKIFDGDCDAVDFKQFPRVRTPDLRLCGLLAKGREGTTVDKILHSPLSTVIIQIRTLQIAEMHVVYCVSRPHNSN